ncbi:hypothetical protein CHL78_011145 [Romboutsia weinsteinii]|uniref:Solute-binding protein family 5 domain-containing protein n=1 Tax=Romboutsia weinsteinii TaxID=2020949 RepID=A0A371J2Y3_9FIRM|nr:ABC transporter substrate-binding protein [Romboutsia weinsteinii]RDY27016.1 hypothetical protein CHL78_011145 [Romboutsia weinsteinii]
MHFKKRVSILSGLFILGAIFSVGCSSSGSVANPDEVMENLSARKAIAMAVDKDTFVDVILNNGSTVADYFVPKRLALDENQKDYRDFAGNMGYEQDDEKAKEEWAKAKEELGFDKVTLDMVLYDTDMNKRLGEYVQSELSILDGLEITIKQMPAKQVMQAHSKGEFNISFNGWGPDYPDALTYLNTFATGQMYGVATNYEGKEYNELLEKGKNSATTEESWETYAQAEKLLLEDAYLSPIYQKGVSYLQKEYVSGIAIATFGPKYSYKWADVDKDEKVFRVSNTADITSLDAAKIKDTLSREVTLNVMEGLVRMDGDLNAVPGMATKWETSENGKTWTFHLRKDAKWSNGEKVTANDFEFSFKRTLDPNTGCENASVFYDIVGAQDFNLGKSTDKDSVGVKAIDDYTLQIDLVRPVNYFDKLVCHPIFSPQNQKFVEEKGDAFGTTIEDTLFNGPFVLSTWKMEDQYSMVKNKDYWDKDTVKLETVYTKVVKDGNSDMNLYEGGEIDRVNLTAEQVDKYKDSPELKTDLECVTYFLMLNGGKSNNK